MTMRHFRLDYVLEDEKDTKLVPARAVSLSMESNFKRVELRCQ